MHIFKQKEKGASCHGHKEGRGGHRGGRHGGRHGGPQGRMSHGHPGHGHGDRFEERYGEAGMATARPIFVNEAGPQSGGAAGLKNCPLCKNHCSLDSPGCPKGEAYAASLK